MKSSIMHVTHNGIFMAHARLLPIVIGITKKRIYNRMRYILLAFLLYSNTLIAQDNSIVRQYNSDSTLMATGVLTQFKRQGLWKYYNAKTNTLLTEGTFKDGIRDGTWTSFYPDGKRNVVADYRDGKLFGPSQVYDADGALKRQIVFQDSVIVGKYVEYYGRTGIPDYVDPKQVFRAGQYENNMKTGQWVEYHEFGELAVREYYEKGLRNGPYLEYSPEGDLITEAVYKEGKLEGAFKRYAYTNAVVEEGNYKNGEKVGEWKRYFPGTKTVAAEESYDDDGNRIGTWKYYYENKRIARVEKYENGIAVGTWEEFFPNKSLAKRKTYELGVPVGEYVEYHDPGQVSVKGQYQNGMKTGVWKSYLPDGELYSLGEYRNDMKTGLWKYFNKIGILIAEGEYSLGLEKGQWVYYYDGGQLKSVGSYKLGMEDGLWGLFYDNKQLTQEETWDNGRLMNISDFNTYNGNDTLDKGTLKNGNGSRITYYVTGKKESEGSYKSGRAEGTWVFYHENGRKASEGQMKEGKKEGPWRYYNPAGRLEDLINYKEDEIVEDYTQMFTDFN